MNENVQGKTFLLVMSILMIVGGAFSVIGASCIVCGSAVIASAYSGTGSLVVYGVITFIAAIVMLVAGIIGCIKAGKPGKVMLCVVLAAIIIVLQIVSNILLYSGATYIVSGIVLPAVYLVAAILKK